MQGVDQPGVVALVQPYGGLVEDIEHAHQRRADLRRQPDALGLASCQSGRGSVDGQVIETDVHQEAQPRPDLLQHLPGDELLFLGKRRGLVSVARQVSEEPVRLPHREVGHMRDGFVVNRHRQALGLEPLAPARVARPVDHISLKLLPYGVGVGLRVPSLDDVDYPAELAVELLPPALVGLVADLDMVVFAPVQEHLHLLFGQLVERRFHREAELAPYRFQHLQHPAIALLERLGPGRDGPFDDAEVRSGTISSGSGSTCVPSPVHTGQAPCGELNEKVRGSMAPKRDAAVAGRRNARRT